MSIPQVKKQEISLPDGRVISIETGKLAKQADGSVVVTLGDTMLLATVVSAPEAKDGVDFMPLTVDYREKFAAAGRVPGGYLKREGRPADDEVLTMRLVDRALRPLFPDDYHADTQVMIQLISTDKEVMPDSLACLAASSALAISDIPFAGPVSEVRVGRLNGEFIVNPTFEQMKEADIDMVIAGTAENIVMVEGEMLEVSEADMVKAIEVAHEAIKAQCDAQLALAGQVEKSSPKREYSHEDSDEALEKAIFDFCYEKCLAVAQKQNPVKAERSADFKAIKEEFVATLSEEEAEEKAFLIGAYYGKTQKKAVRDMMLNDRTRLDGRKLDEIRPIWSEIDCLPGAHGSAVFTRGETQSLTTLTLGSKLDEQMIDTAIGKRMENFMLHYNFPPFSTGEARPIRGVSRREIGHGNLALRALKNMLPQENFPYVIRIVSDILESNGSSSMATVCAGTLALLDGGVNIKKPVSGIAMGLITEKGSDKYAVLSDILGDEDHLGDMDFKVTGTRDGITACQMDIKVDGLSFKVLTEALEQARVGRLHILDKIEETISEPREDFKPHVPRIESFEIPGDMIGAVIGPGGKVIQEMQKDTDTVITIEETEDGNNGIVSVASNNAENMAEAIRRIKLIVWPPKAEVGETYEGKVKSIMPYGAFVEVVPGTDGLLHVSEIDWTRVEKVEDHLKEGDIVQIKVLSQDPRTKKLKLSRKVLLPKPEKKTESDKA